MLITPNSSPFDLTDRKKDLVKLQQGEYISLGKVESEMKTCPLVDNICIYADPSKLFTVALLVPATKQVRIRTTNLAREKRIFLCGITEIIFCPTARVVGRQVGP
jgi:long-chain acyl-CoA synthetase